MDAPYLILDPVFSDPTKPYNGIQAGDLMFAELPDANPIGFKPLLRVSDGPVLPIVGYLYVSPSSNVVSFRRKTVAALKDIPPGAIFTAVGPSEDEDASNLGVLRIALLPGSSHVCVGTLDYQLLQMQEAL